MGSRHQKPVGKVRRRTKFAVVGALVAVCVALVALGIVQLSAGAPSEPVRRAAQSQSVSQDGRIVALSDTSVTAVSADGLSRTYLVTPETTAVTPQGGQAGAANVSFTVNDEVSIVGEFRNGTPVATAVAAREVSTLNGPPMDFPTP